MGTIAKGEITLSPVNDAYTVSITPATCTINADFSGVPTSLSNARGTIIVKRGSDSVPSTITSVTKSETGIQLQRDISSAITHVFSLDSIPVTETDGWIDFTIVTDDVYQYTTVVRFTYTVVRESTMLDWIQDWEGSKTKIGGTYIMTPKLFVGKKEDVAEEVDGEWTWKENALTGVYIGPDLLQRDKYGVGIYGYIANNEVFHLNADGGFIGGWTFNEGGLQSSNGIVNILSEGTIYAKDPESTVPYWGLYANGSAFFANGNVKFYSNGNAEFAGKVIASSGSIAGWDITPNQLSSKRIIIDSNRGCIGIFNGFASKDESGNWIFPSSPTGAIKLWYSSESDFGLIGYTSSERVFEIGVNNFIAGWHFNHQAIWTGSESPYLTQNAFATNADELTLAPNGLRSHNWYIDADGTAKFCGGSVSFDTDKGEMFGWLMRSTRFSTKHAALTSLNACGGVFVSTSDLSECEVAQLLPTISRAGGICMYSTKFLSNLEAYDKSGNCGFLLTTSGENKIGNWMFNHQSIYTVGTEIDDTTGFTNTSNSIVLATTGLVGQAWKLMGDGSGAVAKGNISWDAAGNVTLDSSVSIAWANISDAVGDTFTKIDGSVIYTGTINASQIKAGTISSSRINADELLSNGSAWGLLQDGSGYLSNGKISWDENGTMTIEQAYLNNVYINGSVYQPWQWVDPYRHEVAEDRYVTCDNIIAGTQTRVPYDIDDYLTWNIGDSGRLIRIANWKYNGYEFSSGIEAIAPSGKYFFEDGISKTKLEVQREIVELIGVGDSTEFYGWAVLNRKKLMCEGKYGSPYNVLAQGKAGGTSSAISIVYQSFDGATLSCVRMGTGEYKINLPEEWGLSADNYLVLATACYSNGMVHACIKETADNYFIISTYYNLSAYDATFTFTISNLGYSE